jgi:hypothetical protein
MSYQAYLENIQAKTGKSPADFRALAEKKGFTRNRQLAPGVKAGDIVTWLKKDFQLRHGHLRPAERIEKRKQPLK